MEEPHNGSGVLAKHLVPTIIVVAHNKYQIINMHLIMNVNYTVMIELHKMFLPMMCMKEKKWIIKLAFIVEYHPPP